jgi:hypothetical protein
LPKRSGPRPLPEEGGTGWVDGHWHRLLAPFPFYPSPRDDLLRSALALPFLGERLGGCRCAFLCALARLSGDTVRPDPPSWRGRIPDGDPERDPCLRRDRQGGSMRHWDRRLALFLPSGCLLVDRPKRERNESPCQRPATTVAPAPRRTMYHLRFSVLHSPFSILHVFSRPARGSTRRAGGG